jgi:hypothetical protein
MQATALTVPLTLSEPFLPALPFRLFPYRTSLLLIAQYLNLNVTFKTHFIDHVHQHIATLFCASAISMNLL